MRGFFLMVVASTSVTACLSVDVIECRDAADCDLEAGGVCVPASSGARWCAYPDGACASGLRFSDFRVGDDLGATCVEESPCTPNTSTCEADTLRECDALGVEHTTACALGCHPTEARCWNLEPTNVGMTSCLANAAVESDGTIPDGAIIDTDSGAVTLPGGGTVTLPSEMIDAPAGGVPVRCFRAKALDIGDDVEVRGTPAIAFAAVGPIRLHGRLSVSARAYDTPGPGALLQADPCQGGGSVVAGFLDAGGGGGAGFGTDGGRGGETLNASGGAAGVASGNPELIPLRGGCRGGVLGAGAPPRHNGGGAIHLVTTVALELDANAGIEASGWGGGVAVTPNYGGGSGGAILVEAPVITTSAGSFLVANGGGGGGKVPGTPGAIGVTRAPGGMGDEAGSPAYGNGGAGGALDTPAHGGRLTTRGLGGGGGGAAGRIRLNTYTAFVANAAAIASPIPSPGPAGRR